MGAEDYRVRLLTSRSFADVTGRLLGVPGVKVERNSSPAESQFRYEDERHIIEFEVADNRNSRSVSIRFAVCNPSSIDSVFTGLVLQVAKAIHPLDFFADVPSADKPALLPSMQSGDADAVREALGRGIAAQRAAWQRDFGAETVRASCDEALQRFIFSRGAS